MLPLKVRMLWYSSINGMGAVHTYFLTDTPSGTTYLVDLKLWKYNKKIYIIFHNETQIPVMTIWWQTRVVWVMAGVSLAAQLSESCWCPLYQTRGATQLPGPPSFLPPNILKSGLVYYPDRCICIMTIPLFSICCICRDMPKWWELLMANWNRGN